ncbi:hypothetical protein EV586_102103 [Tumebacillus sp. BK434]|uniref:hypothetical protein n=1 Tax=Tumebacillus sp. BK434 TaxID=2512169 RepID=UPI001044E00B|nr:hypothetical protein [Tumebacillus sp. BK434]TCP57659.1 hypothetical protein EV586_102103 [Tumebacillus sp. BK434]
MKKVVKIPVTTLLGDKSRIAPPIVIEVKGTHPTGITNEITNVKDFFPIGIPAEYFEEVKSTRPIGISTEI